MKIGKTYVRSYLVRGPQIMQMNWAFNCVITWSIWGVRTLYMYVLAS